MISTERFLRSLDAGYDKRGEDNLSFLKDRNKQFLARIAGYKLIKITNSQPDYLSLFHKDDTLSNENGQLYISKGHLVRLSI